MSAVKCSICGREIVTIMPCAYNRRGLYTCDDCCEACFRSEPFPCQDHENRRADAPVTE